MGKWVGYNNNWKSNGNGYHRDVDSALRQLQYRSNDPITFTTVYTYITKIELKGFAHITSAMNLNVKVLNNNNVFNMGNTTSSSASNGNYFIKTNFQSNYTTNILATFNADITFNNILGKGIKSLDIQKISWDIKGFSYFRSNISPNAPTDMFRKSNAPGWIYLRDNNNNYKYSFLGFERDAMLEYIDEPNDTRINYITKSINFEKINLEFSLQVDKITDNAPFRVYLSKVNPNTINNTYNYNSFTNFLNACTEIDNSKFNTIKPNASSSSDVYYFRELGMNTKDFKYILFVGKIPTDNTKFNYFSLFNIKIENNEYHTTNNVLIDVNNDIIPSTPITNAVYNYIGGDGYIKKYYTISGNANGYDLIEDLPAENKIVKAIKTTSKVGNGTFKIGIWKNGVWNNGYRDDQLVTDFDDIESSFRRYRDATWTFTINGEKNNVDKFKVGDVVSIGNIIGININNDRKIIKDSFRIVSKTDTSLTFTLNTSFPLMRIEKDSKFHKIKITKNVWLSGVFLNGYFKGIWNNGLFKGYPKITEMFDTHWIDGRFEGGHFKNKLFNNDSVIKVITDNNNIKIILSVLPDVTIGDIIELYYNDFNSLLGFDKEVSGEYTGEYQILKINETEKSITLDGDFINEYSTDNIGEKLNYRTQYRTGLIQNANINTLNVSKIASNQSSKTEDVYSYFTWIDVIYDNSRAVNIGKYQTLINKDFKNIYSENNHYGYPTEDILSSSSLFRDSNSIADFRYYKLGAKYKIYNDFVGESSKFDEYFDTTEDITKFEDEGWKCYDNSIYFYDTYYTKGYISDIGSTVSNYNDPVNNPNYDTPYYRSKRNHARLNNITPVNSSNNLGYGTELTSLPSKQKPNFFVGDIIKITPKSDIYQNFASDYQVLDIYKNFDYGGQEGIVPWLITIEFKFSSTQANPGYAELVSSYKRTIEDIDFTNGNELKVNTSGVGTMLNIEPTTKRIFNKTNAKIEKNRYSIVEFEMIKFESDFKSNGDIFSDVIKKNYYSSSLTGIEPVINFNNSNYQLKHLPIKDNIDYSRTGKKIEYFFNKRDLNMIFRGEGFSGKLDQQDAYNIITEINNPFFIPLVLIDDFYKYGVGSSYLTEKQGEVEIIIDDLKFYEVDMIPFFKYFIDTPDISNINKYVQIPYMAESPYVEYIDRDFDISDNINISIEDSSINLTESNTTFEVDINLPTPIPPFNPDNQTG